MNSRIQSIFQSFILYSFVVSFGPNASGHADGGPGLNEPRDEEAASSWVSQISVEWIDSPENEFYINS